MTPSTSVPADFSSACRLVAAADTVVAVGHVRPDADAVGSVCAMVRGLSQLGKRCAGVIGQDEALGDHLLTIPGAAEVACGATLPGADLYVVVDCASLERTGAFAAELELRREKVVVIDHHESNPGFGAVDVIVPEAESTTVLVEQLLYSLPGVELDRELAHCLYAGLMTDTGSFRWGGPRMHEAAGRWLGFELDPRRIAGELVDSVSSADLRMIGAVLDSACRYECWPGVLLVLTAPRRLIGGHPRQAVEVLIDLVAGTRDADVAAVLKEVGPACWSVSLRSATLNVAEIAARLGGGGHRAAAGVTLTGTREDVVVALQKEIGHCRQNL
ncbi:hypothetical protein CATYP_04180 [Corynebacterium atypicum]|uniref:Exopolyphosphatase n=1 Tax=Corynebacterium atypicum TaxID=191610 RepID=A0ABM5QMI8_9CORY|nr:DHH family phosphoesterase [Corynebacterium atypicum]AIG63982.1 hypothetical protein CATYP_04180 [Corynebacterium atypicum]